MGLWRKIRTYGFKESCLRLVRKYVIKLIQLECHIAADYCTKKPFGFIFKTADKAVLERLSAQSFEVSVSKIKSFYQRMRTEKHLVFAIQSEQNSDICGYYCLAFDDVHKISNVFTQKVDETTGYFYDDLTFKNYLRQGLHTYSIQQRLQICAEHNKSIACIHIRAHNQASLKSYKKMGFQITQTHYFIRIFRWKLHFTRDKKRSSHDENII